MKRLLAFGCLLLAAVLVGGSIAPAARADEFEQEPINYSGSTPSNVVSRLAERIEKGETKLSYTDKHGYLEAVLKELNIPESSQMLVFSKTSLQRNRIAPRTPRAIYFSDDVYLGFCVEGDVLEISAADPELGAVFYTIDQDDESNPRIMRQTDNCLMCHGSSQTKNVPGHVVRSVFVNTTGFPILSSGSHRIDHTSPIEDRWGGWYVTGTHGEQKHLGNLIIKGREVPRDIDNAAGLNVTKLEERFDTTAYLTPHSDIVALMVLEHQVDAHNYLTRASMLTRQALHYQEALNRELNEPEDHLWDSTKSRIKNAGEPLVEYMLYSGEAKITAPIAGTSGFAAEFVKQGPRDSRGRSLRDLDLQTRLFKYPCSYLIYSGCFKALPEHVKDYVLRRLHEVLSGQDQSKQFAHLSAEDRQAIREILLDTMDDLPDYWRTEEKPAE